HDRHHHDQRRDAEGDADKRDHGDDRDETLAPASAEIAEGEQPFEAGERPRAGALLGLGRFADRQADQPSTSRLIAASGVMDVRSPVARRFSSTSPAASPFGPTTSCHGSPIRSIVANFAPALASTSS